MSILDLPSDDESHRFIQVQLADELATVFSLPSERRHGELLERLLTQRGVSFQQFETSERAQFPRRASEDEGKTYKLVSAGYALANRHSSGNILLLNDKSVDYEVAVSREHAAALGHELPNWRVLADGKLVTP